MLLSGIATVSAFLLIGIGARSERKGPLFMLGGFAAFVLAVYWHVLNYSSLLPSAAAISVEIGIGFWLLAGMLSAQKKPAKAYFFAGAVSMTAAVFLFMGVKFLTDSDSNQIKTLLVELGPDDTIEEI